MKLLRILATLALLFAALPQAAAAVEPGQQIPRSQIETMFDQVRARTAWDLDGQLLWGYYFTGDSRARLEAAANVLVAQGYRLVEILPPGEERLHWQLHVERVEHHTPDSLFARNAELYALAARLHLSSYDGMDVGPASQP